MTNSGQTLRNAPEGTNPYRGLSENELWGRKPEIKANLAGTPTEEELARMQKWHIALEETASNPYRGRSARELLKMKPIMHRVGAWPKDQEEHKIFQWWHAMRKADPDQEWKMPIEFYGVVLNQSNQPISGTQIKVSWSAVDGTTPKMSLTTDASGLFSVTNILGKGISVIVGRIGCHPYLSARQGFEYFDIGCLHTPDPTNPVVFRLWEYMNPEPMYHPNVRMMTLSVDDKPIWVDVQTGSITNSGHVGFSVLRNDSTNLTAGYTITLHAAEGGGLKLGETDDVKAEGSGLE